MLCFGANYGFAHQNMLCLFFCNIAHPAVVYLQEAFQRSTGLVSRNVTLWPARALNPRYAICCKLKKRWTLITFSTRAKCCQLLTMQRDDCFPVCVERIYGSQSTFAHCNKQFNCRHHRHHSSLLWIYLHILV